MIQICFILQKTQQLQYFFFIQGIFYYNYKELRKKKIITMF